MQRSRLFQESHRWLTRIVSGLRVLHQGVWLGALDREALQDVTAAYYRAAAPYPDRGYNTAGLKAWEALLIDRFFGDCASVLVGCAGGGRETVALARRGLRVEAFDCAPGLVETCRQLLASEGLPARVFLAPPDRVPEEAGLYDGLVLGWGGYTHIVHRAARVGLLQDLRPHLRPGGPLLLSFLARRDTPSLVRTDRLVLRIARSVRRLRGSREGVELGDTLGDFFAHRFTRAEIEDELRSAGFRLEYYSDQDYGVAVATAGREAVPTRTGRTC